MNILYHLLSKIQRKPLSGTKIKILWLAPARNAPLSKNAYIGMEGEVVYDGDSISIFTGTSWLVIGTNKFFWVFAD